MTEQRAAVDFKRGLLRVGESGNELSLEVARSFPRKFPKNGLNEYVKRC